MRQGILEHIQILFRRQPSEQQKINRLLKTEFPSLQTVHQIINIISLIIKPSLGGNGSSVDQIIRGYIGYLSKPCKHAFSGRVSQPSFYIIFNIQVGINSVTMKEFLLKSLHTGLQTSHFI